MTSQARASTHVSQNSKENCWMILLIFLQESHCATLHNYLVWCSVALDKLVRHKFPSIMVEMIIIMMILTMKITVAMLMMKKVAMTLPVMMVVVVVVTMIVTVIAGAVTMPVAAAEEVVAEVINLFFDNKSNLYSVTRQ